MTILKAHRVLDNDATVAMVHPASKASVDLVMAASPDDKDGRSQFVWVRLSNGDLVLGVYPQGDTCFSVEVDATFPIGL